MPDLTIIKDLSIVVAGIVALITFVFGLGEYVKRGRQERALHFVEMRRRFLGTPEFKQVLSALHAKDDSPARLPVQDKRNFIGFFEEVALLVNSGMLRADVAHYMYGHYVLLADGSSSFWENLDRDSVYWTLFRKFAADMRNEKKENPRDRLTV